MPILEIFLIFAPIIYVSLNYIALMIQIQVFMNKQAMLTEKPVFERLVSWDNSVRFPVDETISAMRAIFSPKAVVAIKFFGEE